MTAATGEVATTPLVAALEGRARDASSLLDAFLGWVADSGVSLYPAQEEAVLEIMDGRHVVLNTPTGSGKSLVAIAMHFRGLALGERSYYTSPIKALVSEKFFALCKVFGADNVGMMTGDAAVNRDAPIICCTAEVLANIALREGADAPVEHVIIDEFHYFSDRDRGAAWQIPLLTLTRATFLLMSATLGDTHELRQRIEQLTGRKATLVQSEDRPVPLQFRWAESPLLETIERLQHEGRSPVYVVSFTQRECAELAQDLTSSNYCTPSEKQAILAAIGGFRFDSPYGARVRRYLTHGVGIHHAGLLPKYRLLCEQLAQQGLLKIIVGTDTLGVGINVPIRTVLFTQLYKYDGTSSKLLTVRDFRQIAGRAGRKGFDDRGYVVCQAPAHAIENRRLEALQKRGKNVVKQKPPKGFVNYDATTFERMQTAQCEPLQSVFNVDHGMILNLLQRDREGRGNGYRELMRLIDISFEPPVMKSKHRREAAARFRSLYNAGIVNLEPRADGPGKRVVLADELQSDFSLYHTLSLFVPEVLPTLDLHAPDYANHVLTLVECILENPQQVIFAQVARAKTELIAELKAAGVEYEERMKALEEVTHPRPNAEFLWAAFDRFEEKHPWVKDQNVRPKSIALEMHERWMTFNEYVSELGLERSEGVLLRYLSQVYRLLVQNVPDVYKSEELLDIIGYLRTMLARVDSSLVQEWEKMLQPGEEPGAELRPVRVDISLDYKSFVARIRAELHQLVRAISYRQWDEAASLVRQRSGDEWTAERFAETLEPYFAEYGELRFDHRARMTENTSVREVSDHVWRVRQVLVDPMDDNMWFVEGEVDLREDSAPAGVLVSVLRISV